MKTLNQLIDEYTCQLFTFMKRAPEAAPRFQLEPMGYRGYIEALPVKKLT